MRTKQAPTHEYKYVPTDFGNIAYREAGSGPVAIFVHGVLLNGHFWDRLIERLGADPIPHGRDAQRPELAVGLRDEPRRA